MAAKMKDADVIQLISHFPAVFGGEAILFEGEFENKDVPLVGYLHVGETNIHGHYVPPDEKQPVIHEHKGGSRAHDHSERNPSRCSRTG